MNSAVAYLRDSGGAAQDLSTLQQREKIAAYCAQAGLTLSQVFEDAARSGTSTAGRDQFLEMYHYLCDHPCALVVWDLSRIARDYDDAQFYLADLRRRGVTVHTIHDALPPGLDGRLLESILAWKNARFSEDLSRNVKRGQAYIREVYGGHIGGIPAGFDSVPVVVGTLRDGQPRTIRKLVVNETEMAQVRRAFEMRAQGATTSEIIAATGLVRFMGALRKLLSNPIYQDYISPDVWAAVQRINHDRSQRTSGHAPRSVHSSFLLSGLLHCERCSQKMHGSTQMRTYRYYRCYSERIPPACGAPMLKAAELEARVINLLRRELLQPQILADLVTEIQRQAAHKHTGYELLLKKHQSDLSDLNRQITHILAAVKAAGHSAALLAELADLEKRKSQLAPPALPVITPMPGLEQLPALVEHALAHGSTHELALLLRTFVLRIDAGARLSITIDIGIQKTLCD